MESEQRRAWIMSDARSPGERPGIDPFLRQTLDGEVASAALRDRIRGALDAEDERSVRRTGARGRALTLLRQSALLLACAAALLVVTILPHEGRRSPACVPVTTDGSHAVPVRLAGIVVCYDCARAGASLADQIACREPGHENGLRLPDGTLWRLLLPSSEYRKILAPALRGTRMAIMGDLGQPAGSVVVADYAPL